MSRLIDADALINEFDQTFLGNNPRGVIRATIENAPTADVRENVSGEWELDICDNWNCNKCGYVTGIWSVFCPNCGADMRERRTNETD